jgi:hypothetical protein
VTAAAIIDPGTLFPIVLAVGKPAVLPDVIFNGGDIEIPVTFDNVALFPLDANGVP